MSVTALPLSLSEREQNKAKELLLSICELVDGLKFILCTLTCLLMQAATVTNIFKMIEYF